jgi:hypothetical protein
MGRTLLNKLIGEQSPPWHIIVHLFYEIPYKLYCGSRVDGCDIEKRLQCRQYLARDLPHQSNRGVRSDIGQSLFLFKISYEYLVSMGQDD